MSTTDRGGERGAEQARDVWVRNLRDINASGMTERCAISLLNERDALAADRDVLANRVAHLEKLRDGRFFVPYEDHQTLAKLRGEDWDARKKAEAERDRLRDMLEEVEVYLEDHEDVVDGDYGEPAANKAMRLLREVRAALSGGRT